MSSLMLLDLTSLTEFFNNPIQVVSGVLTSTSGVYGYILVMLCLLTIVWAYTKNAFSVGVFIVIYGIVADILYPPTFAIIINVLGIGIIFGGVFYKGVFASD